MRAVTAHELGPPESFVLEEVDVGRPGPGEVRIAIRAAGVSFVDVLVATGGYQLKPPLPYIPGSEFAGVIDAVGESVSPGRIGERVCVLLPGKAFAEQAIVPAEAAYPIPAGLSFAEGAVFQVSYVTGYHALVQRGQLKPSETVLVLGAGGAIGLAAIQIAKALGARVIASASNDEKRALAIESGADAAVDSGAADWRDAVRAVSDGRGPDLIVDPVGGALFEPAFRSLAWGGRHLMIGFAGGPIPSLRANLPLLKGASLVGVDCRQAIHYQPELKPAILAALAELHARGAISPKIATIMKFEDYAAAMELAASGRTAGRVVLAMVDPSDAEDH